MDNRQNVTFANGLKLRVQQLNCPSAALIIVAAVYLVYVTMRLWIHDMDPSFFITAGDKLTDSESVPGNVIVQRNSSGYDGQFYHRLALEPFPAECTNYGITLDDPPYRHQRILYSLIVWTLSLGEPHAVPAIMIFVNYVALCLIGLIGGRLMQMGNRHALEGVVFAFYPGFLMSLNRDLPEALAACFLLASLYCLRLGKHWTVTVLLALAVMTRETTLLVAVGGLILSIWEDARKERQVAARWYHFAIPLALYVVWQLILYARWGRIPVFNGPRNIGLPFVGFGHFLRQVRNLPTSINLDIWFLDIDLMIWLFELLGVVTFTIGVMCCLRFSKVKVESLGWVIYVILIFSLTNLVWTEHWSSLRVLSEYFVLGVVVMLGSPCKLRYALYAPWGILWVLVAFAYIWS